MASVLLINLPINGIDISKKNDATAIPHRIFPPVGLIYIADRLMEMESIAKIRCIDYNLYSYESCLTEDDYSTYINRKLSENELTGFDFVCVSLNFSSSYSFFEQLVKCVKKMHPDCTLICGGTHATNTPDIIFKRNKEVDFVVCGEGEEVLPLLINSIRDNTSENIAGVHTKNNIKWVDEKESFETARLVKDINLNLSAYDYFDMNVYTKHASRFNLSKKEAAQKSFPIMTSRGCPVHCTFCAARSVHGRKARWRSIENIYEEIIFLYENYDVTSIQIIDDNFIPKEKALKLFDMLSELPIPDADIVIHSMSVNHTDFEMLDAMKKANIDTVVLAIESGNAEVQKNIGKYCNLDKAVELIDYAGKIGLNTWCYYMLGFPHETQAQMQETVEYSKKAGSDWVSYSVAIPYPGTKMYRQFVEMGCIEDSPSSWTSKTVRDRTFDTDEISAADIKELAYVANLKYNFVNNRHIQEKRYDEAERIFLDFIKTFDFHIFAYDCLKRVYNLTKQYNKAEEIEKKMNYLMDTNPASQGFKKYMYLLA